MAKVVAPLSNLGFQSQKSEYWYQLKNKLISLAINRLINHHFVIEIAIALEFILNSPEEARHRI